MLPHHQRIADEYTADAIDAKRERCRFAFQILGWCWLWVLVGGLLMAQAFHIDATVGWIYFPKLMAKAEAYFQAGLFIGTAGPLASLLIGWRRAVVQRLLD